LNKQVLLRFLFIALEVLGALIVGAILITIAGADPIEAYIYLLEGAFGSVRNIINTLIRTSPLILTGLAIIIAFKSGSINLGAEGQLVMGAAASTWVGITFIQLPAAILLPLILASGFLVGALWSSIVGILRVKLDINEIIAFLMMNYIAVLFVDWAIKGPLQDPTTSMPISRLIPPAGWLPQFSGTRLHFGILIALSLTILIYILLKHTTLGYKMKFVGSNPEAANYGGINVSKTMFISMMLSGGLAGLAGAIEIVGVHHRLIPGFDPGYGWTGIAVATISGLNPIGAVFGALFFGGINIGVKHMSSRAGVPIFLSLAIEALVVIFVLAGEGIRILRPNLSFRRILSRKPFSWLWSKEAKKQ
jgi:simple sugar transport system permease protein